MAPVSFTAKSFCRGGAPTPLSVNGQKPAGAGVLFYDFSRRLEGEAQGEATAAFVAASHASNPASNTAAGILYFEGTLLGKKGWFSATLTGVLDFPRIESKFEIIEAATGGELAGLKGSGYYIIGEMDPDGDDEGNDLHFDVELP
ncbi:hypothetical protein Q8F55_009278 [Vanrija albida]|uniref:Dirigent protein n=1 Tax=Vanrija albida TaxID=181172 RepID=A0ABR3PT75_9TREE